MEKSTLTKPYSILEKIETECCKKKTVDQKNF